MTKLFATLALATTLLFPVTAAHAAPGPVDMEIVAASGNTARTRPVARAVAKPAPQRKRLVLAYLEPRAATTMEQLLDRVLR